MQDVTLKKDLPLNESELKSEDMLDQFLFIISADLKHFITLLPSQTACKKKLNRT